MIMFVVLKGEVYVLEFEYANAEIADYYLYWLDGEEADLIDNFRINTRKG